MQGLVDIGANLTHDSFDVDRAQILVRAHAAGVERILVTGTTTASSVAAAELASQYPGQLFATAGVHPHHATECDASAMAQIAELASNPVVVAAGECGLDYFRDFSPRDDQVDAFEQQLALATTTGLPAFLHQRDAHDDFVKVVRTYRDRLSGGVAHCFTEGVRELAAYLELDLYIGVTGWVCDERRGKALQEAVPKIPLDRLLLETDAPYLLPRTLRPRPRSRRNEPAYLAHILNVVAELTDRHAEEIAEMTSRNADRLFDLSHRSRAGP